MRGTREIDQPSLVVVGYYLSISGTFGSGFKNSSGVSQNSYQNGNRKFHFDVPYLIGFGCLKKVLIWVHDWWSESISQDFLVLGGDF